MKARVVTNFDSVSAINLQDDQIAATRQVIGNLNYDRLPL